MAVRIFLWCSFLLPWVSLFFLKNSSLRKYISVAMFATVIDTIMYQVAWKYDWWRYKETLFEWDKMINVSLVYSFYLVGTIWIFYFTFRKFWIYMLVNLIIDGLFVFGLSAWTKKLGIWDGKLPGIIMLLFMLVISVILYGYQIWQEKQFKDPVPD